jgi:hypothetical protein
MMIQFSKGWLGRVRVYSLGHTEGERTWLATFRHRDQAEQFVRSMGFSVEDPVKF